MMTKDEKIEQDKEDNPHKNRVHRVLAHSYLVTFFFFLVGLFLDSIFPLKIFEDNGKMVFGAIFLVLGTALIFWAQGSSLRLSKEDKKKDTFYRGPYKYTRSPTHFGLLLLMLGFGITANAMFIIIFSIISFLISKIYFLRKEEQILVEKYGTPYLEYKKAVKF